MISEDNSKKECSGCGRNELDHNITLYDIYLPPTVPRQLLSKPCLSILLDSEKRKKELE